MKSSKHKKNALPYSHFKPLVAFPPRQDGCCASSRTAVWSFAPAMPPHIEKDTFHETSVSPPPRGGQFQADHRLWPTGRSCSAMTDGMIHFPASGTFPGSSLLAPCYRDTSPTVVTFLPFCKNPALQAGFRPNLLLGSAPASCRALPAGVASQAGCATSRRDR